MRSIISSILFFSASISLSPQAIRHFKQERETGAEMRPTIASGIVARDASVSYWPIFVLLSFRNLTRHSSLLGS